MSDFQSRLCALQDKVDRLTEERDRYREALETAGQYLSEAAETIEGWGGYASEYFQQKWHLDRDVQEAKAAHAAVVKALRGGEE